MSKQVPLDTLPSAVHQMVLDLDATGLDPFRPHLAKLYQCFRRAMDEWIKMGTQMPDAFPDLSGRTRASFVYDLAATRAKVLFNGTSGVQLTEHRGFLAIVIDERYVLRLRKLDKKMLACENHTRQSRLYFSGRVQMVLPEIARDLIPMICGYQLDAFQTNLSNVCLSMQFQRSRVWFEDIPDVVIDVEDRPCAPASAPDSPRKSPRVRLAAKRKVNEIDAPNNNLK